MTEEYQIIRTILARVRSLGTAAMGYPYGDYRQAYMAALAAVIDIVEEEVTRQPVASLQPTPRPRLSPLADIVERVTDPRERIVATLENTTVAERRDGWTVTGQDGHTKFLPYSEWVEVDHATASTMMLMPPGWRLFLTRVEASERGLLHNTIPARRLLGG